MWVGGRAAVIEIRISAAPGRSGPLPPRFVAAAARPPPSLAAANERQAREFHPGALVQRAGDSAAGPDLAGGCAGISVSAARPGHNGGRISQVKSRFRSTRRKTSGPSASRRPKRTLVVDRVWCRESPCHRVDRRRRTHRVRRLHEQFRGFVAGSGNRLPAGAPVRVREQVPGVYALVAEMIAAPGQPARDPVPHLSLVPRTALVPVPGAAAVRGEDLVALMIG